MSTHQQHAWRLIARALFLFGLVLLSGQALAERILVFSKTSGFRHASIEAGQAMFQSIAGNNGWSVDLTEDSADFTNSNLAQYDVVVWLSTTGNVLNATQQVAFESYIENGGGYVGVHAAADTEYSWPWYGDLVGAYFDSHPAVQTATLDVEDRTHPSTEHLGATWIRQDEWYNYQSNPRANVNVLLSLDESTYNPGNGAMGDHPLTWYQNVGAGRSFYTGLGHTEAVYQDPEFIQHIEGALRWAGELTSTVPDWTGAPPPDSDFITNVLGSTINQPMELDISAAGDLYVIGRLGEFYALENGTLNETSVLPVNSVHEGGLIGFALDPDFVNNRHAYFHYTDPNLSQHNISRITLNTNNTLNFSSESVLLSYPVQLDECCHVGGSMDFDSQGNLYIATGDNTNPFASDGYAPIDETPGRSAWDAQKSSSNTADLRGKIIRITPTASGGYIIPTGNLFTGDANHRPEIYTMGHRNPFRIAIDSSNDWLYWGEIGPDAGSSNPNRGPGGYDELNRTATPGNFGWPYFSGENEAYLDYNFATATSGAPFDPNNPVNDSPNNTGATSLPAAQPAWVTMSHRALMLADVYRWDASVDDAYKLPSYFHGRLIYWNFNNDQMFEADTASNDPSLRQWLDTSVLAGIIDGRISPANNRLYLIAYGGNCCGKPNDAGLLVEVRYTGNGDTGGSEGQTGYAINAGAGSFQASDGTDYQADTFFSGGQTNAVSTAIAGTNDDELYQSHRWQSGGFSYSLPLEEGDYDVTLHFAETYYINAGQRQFSVDAEGSRVISGLDLVATVGADAAYEKRFQVSVVDGQLTLDFVPEIENPLISAIQVSAVSPFTPGTHITLTASINNQYVTVGSNGLVASESSAGNEETFLIVDAGNGAIALQSLATGNYVTVPGGGTGPLAASATSIGINESFYLIENDNGSFSLQSLANGNYVVAENAGAGSLKADREAIGIWEEFSLTESEVCDTTVSGYAIECRPNARPYLNMPAAAASDLSNVPQWLSQTGAFEEVASLTPREALLPFEPIAPLWSDRAAKFRWVAIPSGTQVTWSEEGKWDWPAGTVFVKHFELPTDETDDNVRDRLETRLLVVREGGLVYGVTYRWLDDESDAELLTTSITEDITIQSPGGNWVQTWTYPSPTDCLACHNQDAKGVLGPKTASLNGDFAYPSGTIDNQLKTLNHLGVFSIVLDENEISTFPAHAYINDETQSLEHRVRSYWDTNCAACHGPQGIAALWDARFETPLADQGVVNGELANQRDYFADYGLSDPKVVDPGNVNNSILYLRDKSVNPEDRMPPLARGLEDTDYINVLERWINSLAPNGGSNGLLGEYYDNLDFTNLALTRVDPKIDFIWGNGSPDASLGANTFSVRWTGTVTPEYSQTYTFYTTSDDGVRLWVDDQLVVDNWTNHAPVENSGSIALTAGQSYDLHLEYYENSGGAVISLEWSSPSQNREIIPSSQLSHQVGQPGLTGRYFNNADFTGFALERVDPGINFTWGQSSPDAALDADTFSVRWTGTVNPPVSGSYTFYTNSDDGVRLWVDGQLLVENWTNHGPTVNSGTINLNAGQEYDLQLDYYENTLGAVIELEWAASGLSRQVIPSSALTTQ